MTDAWVMPVSYALRMCRTRLLTHPRIETDTTAVIHNVIDAMLDDIEKPVSPPPAPQSNGFAAKIGHNSNGRKGRKL